MIGRSVCIYKKNGVMAFVGAFLSCGRLGFFVPGASDFGPGVVPRPRAGIALSPRGFASFNRSVAEIFPLPMSSLVWPMNLRDSSCAAFSRLASPAIYYGIFSRWHVQLRDPAIQMLIAYTSI